MELEAKSAALREARAQCEEKLYRALLPAGAAEARGATLHRLRDRVTKGTSQNHGIGFGYAPPRPEIVALKAAIGRVDTAFPALDAGLAALRELGPRPLVFDPTWATLNVYQLRAAASEIFGASSVVLPEVNQVLLCLSQVSAALGEPGGENNPLTPPPPRMM